MEAIKVLAKILINILTALYELFGFSLLLSFLTMFFYLYVYEPIHAGKGWKSAIVTWYQKFKESVFFRNLFLLAFVTSMILFKMLLNRSVLHVLQIAEYSLSNCGLPIHFSLLSYRLPPKFEHLENLDTPLRMAFINNSLNTHRVTTLQLIKPTFSQTYLIVNYCFFT